MAFHSKKDDLYRLIKTGELSVQNANSSPHFHRAAGVRRASCLQVSSYQFVSGESSNNTSAGRKGVTSTRNNLERQGHIWFGQHPQLSYCALGIPYDGPKFLHAEVSLLLFFLAHGPPCKNTLSIRVSSRVFGLGCATVAA